MRPRPGTTLAVVLALALALALAAQVRIAVQRALAGRLRGKKCAKPSRKLRRAKKCTRWQSIGTLVRQGAQGDNSMAFTGRVGRTPLAAGRHRLALQASAGTRRSTTRTVGFRIAKR